jgi:hypothetical protein
MNGKALCLICSEDIDVLKDYNIAKHYSLEHKEKYKNCWCSESIALKVCMTQQEGTIYF